MLVFMSPTYHVQIITPCTITSGISLLCQINFSRINFITVLIIHASSEHPKAVGITYFR